MYNTKHLCTYKSSDVFLENDNITDHDKNFIRDALYRNDLLHILNIDEYNEEILDITITELHKKLQMNNDLRKIMSKLASSYMSVDETFGLLILFSFDFLDLTHICISEFIETGTITKENIIKLNNIVFS